MPGARRRWPGREVAPGLPRLAARKRARRTPGYEGQKPMSLAFMPHARSAAVCALLQTRADYAARRRPVPPQRADSALEDSQVQVSRTPPISAIPVRSPSCGSKKGYDWPGGTSSCLQGRGDGFYRPLSHASWPAGMWRVAQLRPAFAGRSGADRGQAAGPVQIPAAQSMTWFARAVRIYGPSA